MEQVEAVFPLPDLGEGLTYGEIVECYIKVGDVVKADTSAMSIETAKAIVELPLPFGGEVVKIHGNVGDVIPVGEPLVTLLTNELPQKDGIEINHLVGQRKSTSGVSKQSNLGLKRRLPPKEQAPRIIATPAVKRLARELGINLSKITGTGQGGSITADDVRSAFETSED